MSEQLTIPVTCLLTLGGLVLDDPPVVLGDGKKVWWSWSAVDGPNDKIPERVFVLFPQSAAGLLCVLARHVVKGTEELPPMPGETPVWWYRDDRYGHAPGWCLEFNGEVHVLSAEGLSTTHPMQALAQCVERAAAAENERSKP